MRTILAATLACLLAAACGRGGTGSPVAPSASPSAASASALTIPTASSASIFGGSVVDFARCLRSSGDAACFSAARPVARVSTAGATAPGAPSGLTTTASGSSVTLTWSAPSSGDPVVTYIIEAGSASGLANLASFATGSTVTTFSTGGVPNGTYYVRVKAQNGSGTSAASNEAVLVIGVASCSSAPNAPTGLAGTVNAHTVTLSWNAPSGGCAPTSYILQAGTTPGSSAVANSNVGNATSIVATGVPSGSYFVRVVAANAFGQSGASNETSLAVAQQQGAILVTVTPNPVPFSGVATSLCPGSANTWYESEAIHEVNGVGVTVLHRHNVFDGLSTNDFSFNYVIPAGGSYSVGNIVWCFSTSSSHTSQTTWSGMDANGNTLNYVGPLVTFLANGGTASCRYSVSPTSQSFPAAGGGGSISVTATPSGCSANWSATSSASFVTITGGASGTTSGTITYSVAPNTGSTSRTGTVTIGGTAIPTVSAAITQEGASTTSHVTILPTQLPIIYAFVTMDVDLSVTGGTGTGLVWSVGKCDGNFVINSGRIPGKLVAFYPTGGKYFCEVNVVDSAGNTGSITYSGVIGQ
ncbi:MAG: fibronectin type III domain-containing protein [Acidobacteriia bacterium]|nr:fibronectin type III domain-containing protein [Terriglobia bacterium]